MHRIPKKHFIDNHVFLAHKAEGISSFGLIAQLRKILGTKKVGHAGTLDPLAYGLMIVAFQRGTKKLSHYLGLDKTYRAEILIGRSTETGDREGKVREQRACVQDFSRGALERVLNSFLGTHFYPAPLYSAVKVEGKPLYRYAREGKTPPFIPEKKMEVEGIRLLGTKKRGVFLILEVEVVVGSGTYIRTLAELIGEELDCPASLLSLHRTAIGPYRDRDAFRMRKGVLYSMYERLRRALTKFISY